MLQLSTLAIGSSTSCWGRARSSSSLRAYGRGPATTRPRKAGAKVLLQPLKASFETAQLVDFEKADASAAGEGLAELLVVCRSTNSFTKDAAVV